MQKSSGEFMNDGYNKTEPEYIKMTPRGPVARIAFTRLQQAYVRLSISPQGNGGQAVSQDYARLAGNLTEVLKKIPADDLQSILNMPDTNIQLAKACWLLDQMSPGNADTNANKELIKATVELLKTIVHKFNQYFRSKPAGGSVKPQKSREPVKQEPRTLPRPSTENTKSVRENPLPKRPVFEDDGEPRTRWTRK